MRTDERSHQRPHVGPGEHHRVDVRQILAQPSQRSHHPLVASCLDIGIVHLTVVIGQDHISASRGRVVGQRGGRNCVHDHRELRVVVGGALQWVDQRVTNRRQVLRVVAVPVVQPEQHEHDLAGPWRRCRISSNIHVDFCHVSDDSAEHRNS